MSRHVTIIAEAGVNHNGDLLLARELVRAAVQAGADIVKFQTFRSDALAIAAAPLADYQKITAGADGGQRELLRRLELSLDDHKALLQDCNNFGIEFLSSAFDDDSITLLSQFNPTHWKIPSGELTNMPYLRRIGAFGAGVFLSTGMADLSEVADALKVLEAAGTRHENITVLHCTTEYPAPYDEVNLKVIPSIRQALGVSVGYSDHTPGIEIAVAAVALGADVIEKHLTLNRNLPGPDHQSSLEPSEFTQMVSAIRHVSAAEGDGVKRPTPSELKNRLLVRKSIVAARPIAVGEALSPENLTTKRPGNGLNPMQWDRVLGRIAIRDYRQDEAIDI